ncbi:glutamate--cysteine ligase (plasmid) [Nicoliella spurrieriana]|uniref:Glutamate--cysteine ligase n=1 Tax=Nicoliella spurrieriana TaxID=2925830 RepID=A0A976RQJ6_9LACO|nr:glutamate--cysteine ligase [Nicoliella spurrieriana]UQS85973.1 glutamate--cysteine ligase [Nicoliella spurrieriana]
MINQFGNKIVQNHLVGKLLNISIGIEIERMRSDYSGNMSLTKHPNGAGSPFKNPWITKDYLESMTEVVTPPVRAIDALHYDYSLTHVLRRVINRDELLWPLSMPAILPEHKDKSLLAIEPPAKQAYFESICERYGITQGAPCGMHINFSFNSDVLNCLISEDNEDLSNIVKIRNKIYTTVAQGFVKYRWLLTYLFGASPVAQGNYFKPGDGPEHPIRSIRQSHFGFIRSFDVDYSSVDHYVDRIMDAFNRGQIAGVAEFHGSVRFRGGKDLEALKTAGIKYLELRMFDLDPTTDTAIKTTTLALIRLMAAYFLMTDSGEFNGNTINQLDAADSMNEAVSLEAPDQISEYADHAKKFVGQLRAFTDQLGLGPEYLEVLDTAMSHVDHPAKTLSARLTTKITNGSLLEYGLAQARQFQSDALAGHFVFDGFKQHDGALSEGELRTALFGGNWDAQ